MSDRALTVLVVLVMLVSPLLVAVACSVMDRWLVRGAREARKRALVEAMVRGASFPHEENLFEPCVECGAVLAYDISHADGCLFVEAYGEWERVEDAFDRAVAENHPDSCSAECRARDCDGESALCPVSESGRHSMACGDYF